MSFGGPPSMYASDPNPEAVNWNDLYALEEFQDRAGMRIVESEMLGIHQPRSHLCMAQAKE